MGRYEYFDKTLRMLTTSIGKPLVNPALIIRVLHRCVSYFVTQHMMYITSQSYYNPRRWKYNIYDKNYLQQILLYYYK